MDLGAAFKKATDTSAPQARQCADPFHVVALANEAINKARRWAWNPERAKAKQAARPPGRKARPTARNGPPQRRDQARWVKHTRWALLKDPDALKPDQLQVLHELRRTGSVLYRCWQLKEGLRDLYRLPDPAERTSAPGLVAGLGLPQPDPRVRHPLQDHPSQPGQHPRRGRARPVQQQARRPELQDPADQPPRLRTPLRPRPHRDDLPLLRRTHHPATHGKVRRT